MTNGWGAKTLMAKKKAGRRPQPKPSGGNPKKAPDR